jgi:hypothetical protein
MIDKNAFDEKIRIIKNLANHATPHSAHMRVLARIAGCMAPYAPCGSFACPVCGPDLGDEFVGMTSRFMRIHRNKVGKEVPWKFVTLIPSPFLPVRTTLDRSRVATRLPRLPADVKREIWFKVQRAEIRTLIGALDFSYSEDERTQAIAAGKAFKPHWSVHMHGLVPADQITPEVVRALHALFPRSDEVPKPIDIKDFDGNPWAIAYSMKTRIQRRLTIMGTSWDRNGQPRLARNTRYRPLRPRQEAELRLMLDRMAMRDRLVLVGVKLCENGSRRWFAPSSSQLTALPPKKIIQTSWPSFV